MSIGVYFANTIFKNSEDSMKRIYGQILTTPSCVYGRLFTWTKMVLWVRRWAYLKLYGKSGQPAEVNVWYKLVSKSTHHVW